jgi:hypothetical protein
MSANSPESKLRCSVEDVAIAVHPVRWVIFRAVIDERIVCAKKVLEIAQKSPVFRGQERAARYHATLLSHADLITADPDDVGLAHRPTEKGEVLNAHLLAMADGLRTDEIQSAADSRVIALMARRTPEDYDLLELRPGEELEFVAALRRRARETAQRHLHLRVIDSDNERAR